MSKSISPKDEQTAHHVIVHARQKCQTTIPDAILKSIHKTYTKLLYAVLV